MAFNWQPVHIPLLAGLGGKTDRRAMEPPALAVCRDAEFEEAGGIQTRKPYTNWPKTPSDLRRIVAHGDELLCFTKDRLYSWSEHEQEWVSKGEYLAPKVDESSVFVRSSEQSLCDRAEKDGVIVYAWLDAASASSVYIAAMDKTTGAVLVPPRSVGANTTFPRLVVTNTRILLFVIDSGTTIHGLSIDVSDYESLADSMAAATTSLVAVNSCYDVIANGSQAVLAVCRTASYTVHRVDAALALALSATKARTCDGPIAVSVAPTNVVQIVRSSGTSILGDLMTGLFVDTYTNQAIGTAAGTPINQIAAAHRSTTDSGVYRCYVTWSAQETASGTVSFGTMSNWVSTGNTLGTAADFVGRTGVASRAFDHDGRVYVWLAFACESGASGMGEPLGFRAQLQNNYFLYRDDGLLVGKAAMAKAGGFSQATGHLPHVQSLGSGAFAWCGSERRIISLGSKRGGYDARAPRDIVVTFDSNEARRTVRVGATIYVTGAQIMQYDGEGLAELGFHLYPWFFAAVDGGAGSKDAGAFTYKSTYSWTNAKGELDRSTTATAEQLTLAAGRMVAISTVPLTVTSKTGDRSPVSVEIWVTEADPSVEAPFHLATSKDPAATSNPNRFLENDTTASFLPTFEDTLADDDVAVLEINPENGGVLENLSPPPASVIAASQDRVFLAGVPADPNRIWYSKLRTEGEIVSFHDALTIELPPIGGAITAVAFLDDTLVAFRETAIFAIPGEGFDNVGGGQNYGPARRLSADVGAVSAEAVAVTPAGLIFKSRKGWYLLGLGGQPQYIGDKVAEFDDDEIVAVHVLETKHQIRCVSAERVLMFDYLLQQWSEWTIEDAVTACVWDGSYVYATAVQVKQELEAHAGGTHGLDVETGWIKLSELQGFGSVKELMVLGEIRSACDIRVRIAYDYKESDASGPTWVDDKYMPATPMVVGGPLQFCHGPRYNRCQAIKVRLTAYASGSTTTAPAGEAVKLTGLSMSIGVQPGLFRRLPASQRQ